MCHPVLSSSQDLSWWEEEMPWQLLPSSQDLSWAIPIKCFVFHRLPTHEGGLVGRAKKKLKK